MAFTIQEYLQGQEAQLYQKIQAFADANQNVFIRDSAETSANAIDANNGFWNWLLGRKDITGHDNFYRVIIAQPDRSRYVTAYIPENVYLDITSTYGTPLLDAGLGGGELHEQLQALGNSVTVADQLQTVHVYQGSSPISYSLPLYFLAQTSTLEDVVYPIIDLFSMCMPEQDSNGVHVSPGPTFATDIENVISALNIEEDSAIELDELENAADRLEDAALRGGFGLTNESNRIAGNIRNGISVALGAFFYMPLMIIENVNADFDSLFDKKDKAPITAKATIQLKTWVNPTARDIKTFFFDNRTLRGDDHIVGRRENDIPFVPFI